MGDKKELLNELVVDTTPDTEVSLPSHDHPSSVSQYQKPVPEIIPNLLKPYYPVMQKGKILYADAEDVLSDLVNSGTYILQSTIGAVSRVQAKGPVIPLAGYSFAHFIPVGLPHQLPEGIFISDIEREAYHFLTRNDLGLEGKVGSVAMARYLTAEYTRVVQ